MSATYTRFKPFEMTAEEAQALPALPGLNTDERNALLRGAGRFTSANLPTGFRHMGWMPVGLVERRWAVVRPEDGKELFVVDCGENPQCPTCGRYSR